MVDSFSFFNPPSLYHFKQIYSDKQGATEREREIEIDLVYFVFLKRWRVASTWDNFCTNWKLGNCARNLNFAIFLAIVVAMVCQTDSALKPPDDLKQKQRRKKTGQLSVADGIAQAQAHII